jgi:hypothetical protein
MYKKEQNNSVDVDFPGLECNEWKIQRENAVW